VYPNAIVCCRGRKTARDHDWRLEAQQDANERGLADVVRPEQAEDRSFLNL
jgi:hypothetical protein